MVLNVKENLLGEKFIFAIKKILGDPIQSKCGYHVNLPTTLPAFGNYEYAGDGIMYSGADWTQATSPAMNDPIDRE